MHEYEVELQFTSSLLGQPDRIHDDNEMVDGNEPVFGTESDMLSLTGEVRQLSLSPAPASPSPETVFTEGETETTQVDLHNL